MSFKKYLGSKKAQSTVEYILTFIVLAAGIIAVALFGGFNPDRIGIKTVFDQAVNNAIEQLNNNE